ncbi:MAG: hypothetical protein JWP91_3689 [Fibrobacteres bacterium]|nr:hypothetical protein [Fibrobacterota bacterium]
MGKGNGSLIHISMRWARLGTLALGAFTGSGCFTEIGNPGKEQSVSAMFRIDYADNRIAVPKASAQPGETATPGNANPAPDSLRIQQFYLNVVEVNYTTLDGNQGRIWKLPDSLGKTVDFTGVDTDAVLPPVAVPPADYSILKLEGRIPAHAALDPDTVAFGRFSGRGYIKGIVYYAGNPIRFLCQFPDDYKINLVYTKEILETWRQGDSYKFDFVFYASRWLSGADLTAISPASGEDGPFVLIDQEHNPDLYSALRSSFFKSFNSSKVWKENPAP